MPTIRPIAIAVVYDAGRLLVLEGNDRLTGETFYRPLGGGIEFGERGSEAVVRELREELGAELDVGRFLGVLENLFTYEGRHGHEIVLVYEAWLLDRSLYRREELEAREDDGTPFRALWVPVEAFDDGDRLLYPDGLLELLRSELEHRA